MKLQMIDPHDEVPTRPLRLKVRRQSAFRYAFVRIAFRVARAVRRIAKTARS